MARLHVCEGDIFYFQNSTKPLEDVKQQDKGPDVLKSLPRLPCGEEGTGRQMWVQEEMLSSKGERDP